MLTTVTRLCLGFVGIFLSFQSMYTSTVVGTGAVYPLLTWSGYKADH
jgi:hypothetical protein